MPQRGHARVPHEAESKRVASGGSSESWNGRLPTRTSRGSGGESYGRLFWLSFLAEASRVNRAVDEGVVLAFEDLAACFEPLLWLVSHELILRRDFICVTVMGNNDCQALAVGCSRSILIASRFGRFSPILRLRFRAGVDLPRHRMLRFHSSTPSHQLDVWADGAASARARRCTSATSRSMSLRCRIWRRSAFSMLL